YCEIIEDLRCRNSAECARRVQEGRIQIVERRSGGAAVGWDIRERRVRFSLSEQEDKAGHAERRLVNDARGEHAAQAERGVLRGAKHFAQRREARIDLWAGVQRITFQSVLLAA